MTQNVSKIMKYDRKYKIGFYFCKIYYNFRNIDSHFRYFYFHFKTILNIKWFKYIDFEMFL